MSKHTPGPLSVCDPGDYGDYNGRSIVLIGDDRRIAVVLGVDEEAQSNAKLFAAAPDLLEALRRQEKGLRNLIELDLIPPSHFPDTQKEADALLALIFKAEGR